MLEILKKNVSGNTKCSGVKTKNLDQKMEAAKMYSGMKWAFVYLILVISIICVMLNSPVAIASDALKSDEAVICFGCHANMDGVKTFQNNEKISVYIREHDFKNTVHSFLVCTNCHNDVSIDKHPSAQYKSKKDFSTHVSTVCRSCHSDEQLMSKPIHKQIITMATASPCSDCHGSHAITKISDLKKRTQSQYCLTCHNKEVGMKVNGKVIYLPVVDEQTIKKSAHNRNGCSDCHASFTMENHPVNGFGSRREMSIAISSEACAKCHPVKYSQFKNSIHANMVTKGNLRSPICADCHSGHAVAPKAISETTCMECHKSISKAYKHSVHGIARIDGKENAPRCSSCHSAHEMKPAHTSQSVKEMCIRCHENAASVHAKWLPNVDMHFSMVSCGVCHVPDAEGKVYLHITDTSTDNIVPDIKIKELLGTKYEEITSPKGENIDARQLWDIYQKLRDKGLKVSFTGTLSLQSHEELHSLTAKTKAIKKCEMCHSADSVLFKSVAMAFISPDGQEKLRDVNPEVLRSAIAALPLGNFYVLGSTRLILLDIIGILMIVGGASLPVIHILARIITKRVRASKTQIGE